MKHLYFVLLCCILCSENIQAQDLYIKFNSGASVNYGLSTVERITFSSSDMQVHVSGFSLQNYGMDSVSYYNYQPTMTPVIIANKPGKKELKLFPNPTDGMVSLNVNLVEASEVQMLLFSLSGQQLLLKKKSVSKGNQELNLDLKTVGIPAGIYIFELRCNRERYINKLVYK